MRGSSTFSVAPHMALRSLHGCNHLDQCCFGDTYVWTSKNDPLVDQVELKQANPTYAHVKYMDGRESTVSLRDLAPCPQISGQIPPLVKQSNTQVLEPSPIPANLEEDSTTKLDSTTKPDLTTKPDSTKTPDSAPSPLLSTREIKPPSRYGW